MSEKKPDQDREKAGISRRFFLKAVGGAGLGTAVLPDHGALGAPAEAPSTGTTSADSSGLKVQRGAVPIELRINGSLHELTVEPRITLLDALRNQLELTGSKLVCDRGSCGACTVHLDGAPVMSCMVLAVDAVGREITTIEGLARENNGRVELDPVQAAFIECDALQCGFCTPGFIMATRAVLSRNPNASLDEIKEGIAGNICRCGTYNHIFSAAEKARAAMQIKEAGGN